MERLGQGIISIKADVLECVRFFDGLNVSEKTITKSIMSQVGQGGRIAARKSYPSILHKRTGKLFKSIKYKVYKNGQTVIFSASADSGKKTSKDGRIARYGYMLASGYTITAKKDWLNFNINGKWVKVKSVHVDPFDFMERPIDRYMDSHDAKERIDKAFDKQLQKLEKKLGVKI